MGGKILAGYDNWSGYYLLSDNKDTDLFLSKFYEKIAKSKKIRTKTAIKKRRQKAAVPYVGRYGYV